ncbi:hypothetical protein KAI32_02445 [Candidatus Pacearchaeota archaeon]|nr:hypothetical protein [Candidatus Pacearchaeota archaeon]
MELKSAEREVEYKASVDEGGNVVLKKKSAIKRGSKSKAQGGQFELKVRKDLEELGWIVDKWSNNVDLDEGVLHPAKTDWKFNPFRKIMMPRGQGTGFPDFIGFQKMEGDRYNVVGIEVKMNGTLSPIEKKKCQWYLDNGIFNEIWIARKVKKKNRVRVDYFDVKDILKRMR